MNAKARIDFFGIEYQIIFSSLVLLKDFENIWMKYPTPINFLNNPRHFTIDRKTRIYLPSEECFDYMSNFLKKHLPKRHHINFLEKKMIEVIML